MLEAYIVQTLRRVVNQNQSLTNSMLDKEELRNKLFPTKQVEQKEQISVPLMEQLKQNVSTPEFGIGSDIGLTKEEVDKLRGKKKGQKKLPKAKPSIARDRAVMEDVMGDVLERKGISTRQDVQTGFTEMGRRFDDMKSLIESNPEIKQI
jgi:hypothetical protein